VLWGLWFFAFLMLERFALKPWLEKIPVLSNLYLLVAVSIGWVIFRYTDFRLGLILAKSLFGLNGNDLTGFTAQIQLQSHSVLLLVSVIASTPVMKLLRQKLEGFAIAHGAWATVWNVVFYSILPVILLLLSTAGLVGDSYNPFIYFQF
jgi:alginate O-acetyltransferase complex protein AlgI